MTGGRKTSSNGERIDKIAQLLREAEAGDYASISNRLRQARHLFHEHLADLVTEPLNRHLATLPHEELIQKQEISKWVNMELRTLGIAIRCPKTGEPAFLSGTQSSDSAHGRFQIRVASDPNFKRTCSSKDLFRLDLMSSPDRYLGADRTASWTARTHSSEKKRDR